MSMLLALLALAASLPAVEEISPLASQEAPLELEPRSAALSGLAGAGVAWPSAQDALSSNPARLSLEKSGGMHLEQENLLADMSRGTASLELGAGLLGSFGFHASVLNLGSPEFNGLLGEGAGSGSASRQSFGLGWARSFFRGMSAGLALQGRIQDPQYGGRGFVPSLDFGVLKQAGRGLFGVAASGLGSSVRLRAGASYSTLSPESWAALVLAGEASYDLDKDLGLAAALEWGSPFLFALRAGWRWQSVPSGEGATGLALGARLGYGKPSLDYAYVPFGDLGSSHRVGLSWDFGSEGRAAPASLGEPKDPDPGLLPPPPLPEFERPQPATEMSKPALELEFHLPESPLSQAQRLDSQGKKDEAMAFYQEAIQADAKDWQAWLGLGHAYYRRGERDFAIQAFEQVLRLKPDEEALAKWLEIYRKKAKARK